MKNFVSTPDARVQKLQTTQITQHSKAILDSICNNFTYIGGEVTHGEIIESLLEALMESDIPVVMINGEGISLSGLLNVNNFLNLNSNTQKQSKGKEKS